MSHEFGIGVPVRRKEDPRLLRGQGSFSADVTIADAAHAVVLRSPHPHARIVSIDTAGAQRTIFRFGTELIRDQRVDRQ